MYKKLKHIRPIFNGGMATLTLAIDAESGCEWVVRELLKKNIFNIRLHRGFVRGIKVRKLLSPHPHIAYSIENGYNGVNPYEIIEYVNGSNLRLLIHNQDKTILNSPSEVLRQCAIALAHVHSKGFLHLDIKPENFLVNIQDGEIKIRLTDFDLSKPATVKFDKKRAGTPVYMAPEHLKHGKISYASDIFAFGVMAYNLVTNKMPFAGNTEKELMNNQVSSRYKVQEPIKINQQLSRKLNKIIMQCLSNKPETRFPSMAYLCKEIGN